MFTLTHCASLCSCNGIVNIHRALMYRVRATVCSSGVDKGRTGRGQAQPILSSAQLTSLLISCVMSLGVCIADSSSYCERL